MNSNFKDRLQQAIKESGLSNSEVARRSGIARGSITDYLKGRYEAKQDKVYDLAKVLGVDSSWLMGFDVEKKVTNARKVEHMGLKEIPVLAGISAGIPMYAESNVIDHTYINETKYKNGKEYFGLIVEGDSMDKEFRPGDIVIVEKGTGIESGQIGVVMVNGFNATVKRVRYMNDSILLLPESSNPQHEPQIYTSDDELTIVGRVVGLVRNY